MTKDEYMTWIKKMKLTTAAIAQIDAIRNSEPERRVQSGKRRNVSGRYPSKKMGLTIQFESHRLELAGIYIMEYDSDVLEFYDQPSKIKLNYLSRSGRNIGTLNTPDYFVIRQDFAGWEEWKPEEELRKLAESEPNRWQCVDGFWRCPPGEEFAQKFGFYYRIRSDAEVDSHFGRNIRFLEDYYRDQRFLVPEDVKARILKLVTEEPGVILQQLLEECSPVSIDDFCYVLVSGALYVDLYSVILAEPETVKVYIDEQTASVYENALNAVNTSMIQRPHWLEMSPGTLVSWDSNPWKIANIGHQEVFLSSSNNTFQSMPISIFVDLVQQGKITGINTQEITGGSHVIQESLRRASPKDMQEANHRYEIIRQYLDRTLSKDSLSVPLRTIRRWKAEYQRAEKLYGNGYIGLLPETSKRGNRTDKLPPDSKEAMFRFIDEQYETIKQQNARAVWGSLCNYCEEKAILAPSYKTFCTAIKLRPRYEQVKKRQGEKVAYKYETFYRELDRNTPLHGDRPFDICHIDHTKLDIETISTRTGKNLGRPWATFLTDAYSRRILAVYLSYDNPSYRSCMMCLRECVRNHGRLPQTIVVDGGKEFHSKYFDTLLALYEIEKKTRPGGKPRYGSVAERLFGTTNTMLIDNLTGNTQNTKNARQMTPAVNPKLHAKWTLGRLYDRLCRFAYELYDTIEHPALGLSPRDQQTIGISKTGKRPYRLISYDREFYFLTLPSTDKETAQLQIGRGVKINSLYYWNSSFLNRNLERTQIPVRYDPWNAGVAYAFVNNEWVKCISEHYSSFRGRSEKEIRLATEELRKQRNLHGKQFSITSKKLAQFLESAESEVLLSEQRIRDFEALYVLAKIHGPLNLYDGESNNANDEPESITFDFQGDTGPITILEEF